MKHCVTGEIIPISIENETIPQLTPREKEVLILTCKGLSSKEIAQKLFISIYTANRHRQNIREKLRAGSMIEALNIARRKGII
jgi:transcriptional regulator, luxR family